MASQPTARPLADRLAQATSTLMPWLSGLMLMPILLLAGAPAGAQSSPRALSSASSSSAAPSLAESTGVTALPIDYQGPIRLLVGFPSGGATDTIARLLAPALQQALGQPVKVDNLAGAGGMLAAKQLRDARADGSTLMLTIDHTHVIGPLTTRDPGFDPSTDFTALAGVAYYYNSLAVSKALSAGDLGLLGAWLRDHPQQARIGVPALGSIPQFAALSLGKSLGARVEVVPYAGGAPLANEIIANKIPLAVAALSELLPAHRSDKLRVLAVTGLKRAASAPDIPTFRELGLFELDVNPWMAVVGPRDLPSVFAGRFTKALAAVLAIPELREKMVGMGVVPMFAPPGQLEGWIKTSADHWRPIIQESGFALR